MCTRLVAKKKTVLLAAQPHNRGPLSCRAEPHTDSTECAARGTLAIGVRRVAKEKKMIGGRRLMAHLMARVIDGNWQVRAAIWDSLQEVTVFVVISVCETDFSKPHSENRIHATRIASNHTPELPQTALYASYFEL